MNSATDDRIGLAVTSFKSQKNIFLLFQYVLQLCAWTRDTMSQHANILSWGQISYYSSLTVMAKAVESGFQTTVTFLPTSLIASYDRR